MPGIPHPTAFVGGPITFDPNVRRTGRHPDDFPPHGWWLGCHNNFPRSYFDRPFPDHDSAMAYAAGVDKC
jgi:hypothetical protein